MESLFILITYFCLGSLFGKIIDFVFLSIKERKFVKTGFLYGPFSPIYGFGALAIYFFEIYFGGLGLPIKFIAYFFIPTGIEYLSSYGLEKIFNLRLWDYSRYHFNINGRICLRVSLTWLALAVLFVFVGQPIIINLLNKIPLGIIQIFSIIFAIYFFIDFFFSCKEHYNLKGKKLRVLHH